MNTTVSIKQDLSWRAEYRIFKPNRGSSVSIVTAYWLDDWSFNSPQGQERNFISLSPRPGKLWVPRSRLSSVYRGLFSGGKPAGAWSWSLSSSYFRGYECAELYHYYLYVFVLWCLVTCRNNFAFKLYQILKQCTESWRQFPW